MGEVFNKIAIVSLDAHLAEVVGKKLSDMLEMTFCSTKDLLEYELSDPERFARLTSEEYLLQSEQRVFAEIASFCDVVISLSYDNFLQGWQTLSSGCALVFLEVKKKSLTDKINKIAFSSRTEQLEAAADVKVLVGEENLDEICEKIVDKLAKKLINL